MRPLSFLLLTALALPLVAQQLTPDEAVRIALENNYGVRIARNTAAIAKLANNPGAAGMLPSVDANGGYSVDQAGTKQEFFTGEAREADNANAQVVSGEVELNWTLFDGLSMFAAKDRLEALERIGESQLRQELEATTYNVLTAYFQLVQLEKAGTVQQEGMETSRERMRITETGERVGAASGLELVQARLDLSADSAQLLALLQQTAMARTALNVGADVVTAVIVDRTLPHDAMMKSIELYGTKVAPLVREALV